MQACALEVLLGRPGGFSEGRLLWLRGSSYGFVPGEVDEFFSNLCIKEPTDAKARTLRSKSVTGLLLMRAALAGGWADLG